MVVSPASGDRSLEAVDFDRKEHVIEYAVDGSKDAAVVVFLSRPGSSTPTFRLTYAKVDADTENVAFEAASPESPAAFNPYVSGRTRRVVDRSQTRAARIAYTL